MVKHGLLYKEWIALPDPRASIEKKGGGQQSSSLVSEKEKSTASESASRGERTLRTVRFFERGNDVQVRVLQQA